ncbi:uncharacterized protein TRAVEDRAFT_49817 [Trametes versicolor FP-101664 SS1]|uniref:uncharacterized protein n=1 Tax=Trametes versicolor (strain FP-101664) TaxID=717944 RepID=UPI00046223E2|nr:uncharacterized protein TRAVEDRAFT_49817 [Trametes versicolor FP-101664 SS1]EIW57006.1 hypothetical protein TRAVEDRAFT_49817 [Trametes versicolor FP-101664 SS1]
MPSNTSASVSEIVDAAHDVRTGDMIDVVVVALLVYDALLCLDKEVRYVWHSPKASRKLSRLLYIYNRYMSVVWNILAIGKIGTISDTVLWCNGNVYFCTMVSLNLANVILQVVVSSQIATDFGDTTYVIQFIDPISSILTSRFLLALYETNAHLQKGGTSASSFSTLDFAGADQPAELPEFLMSLGGPIHSIDDDDPELFSLEPTPQRETEADLGAETELGARVDSEATGEFA